MRNSLAGLSFLIAIGAAAPTARDPNAVISLRQQNPCAEVAAILREAPNPETAIVKPSLAYACLNDVPLDVNGSIAWLESVRPYLELQTTLAYLKTPGDEYLLPAIDVLGLFDSYVAGIATGMFGNQYELEVAITNLTTQAHDGHFLYASRLATSIFQFGRSTELISIATSADSPIPAVYLWSDIEAAVAGTQFEPSEIVSINDQDLQAFLDSLSLFGNCQDPDALYNQLQHNKALIGLPASANASAPGVFAGAVATWLYPGDNTSFRFANNSAASLANVVTPLVDFENVTSGQDLYNIYVNPTSTTTSTTATPTATSTSTPPPLPRPGYPNAVLGTQDNLAVGYYLPPESNFSSTVAVLSIGSFDTITTSAEFQSVIYDFISNATSNDNKTRLIIDLTGNPGGTVNQGYSLFTNLFPDIYPAQNSRTRATPYLNAMGNIASKYVTPYPFDVNTTDLEVIPWFSQISSGLNYREILDNSSLPFSSWSDVCGPQTYQNDNFTNLFQLNFSDPVFAFSIGFDVNGFGTRTNLPPARPFANPEDIIILTDGICASTCSLFVDLMRDLAGVKTVVAGGRPKANSSMPAVGGTRGTRVWPFEGIYNFANATQWIATTQGEEVDVQKLKEGGVDKLIDGYAVASKRGYGSVNSRDLIRTVDEEEGWPAQFRYEPADCRIWYTAKSAVNAAALWEDVAAVAWGDGGCAWGTVRGANGPGQYGRPQ